MANPLKNPLAFLFGSSVSETKEMTTDVIKIRGRIILMKDKIIQIRNLASIEIVSLAAGFPWAAPFLILIGLMGAQSTGLVMMVGYLLLLWGAFLLFWYFKRKNAKGLLFSLNSGLSASTMIVDVEFEFLRQVALVLYNIIQEDDIQNLDIYLDQKRVITVEYVSNSVISLDSVGGSITNAIK
ncbi:MAG TPA: hypothetical protein VFS21_04320 [Roseiflexaceae bacterium]|nr:hypothetical protein [Roseiflexaceae bacterium]